MIDVTFFSRNRRNLTERIGGGLVVLTAYTATQRSADMEQSFLQESNFWYLTGIVEPSWRLIIDGSRHYTWLVKPDVDEIHKVFNGGLLDDEAKRLSGVNEVISTRELEPLLRRLSRKHSLAHTLGEDPYASYYDFVLNPAQKELTQVLRRIFNDVRDCRIDLAKLRAIKQPVELAAMQQAIDLTVEVFDEVRLGLTSLKSEYAIDALFTYRFRQANALHAYHPVVGSGPRSCVLHHGANNQKFGMRDMVVVDIGALVDGYCADITRTFCLKPTKRQKAVHAAVERAQKQIIDLIKPGLALADYLKKSDEIMKEALIELGLLSDSNDSETYRKYFPHAISHGLGIDPHDSLGAPRFLEAGMVLTVEPGIYIPEESIGVRIEDDILVTNSGNRNLSGKLSTSLN